MPNKTAIITITAILFLLPLSSCAPTRTEVVHINDLWIVYTSRDRINEEWKARGKPGKVEGFYDHHTNTIWVEKGDYHTMGHELKHATDGYWHD